MSEIQHSPGFSPAERTVEIRPGGRYGLVYVRELWDYRELLQLLVLRDIRVRYKQTVLGAAWAVIQPVFTMVVFSVVFGAFAKVPSDGLPYPIFAFTALLPWSYFQQAMTRGGTSLVGNAGLISKVYFPRVLIPLSSALAPAVDFVVAFVVLLGLMAYYGLAPGPGVLLLPLFLIMATVAALSVSFWVAAANVRYRDVGHLVPFIAQLWLYATPVAYPMSVVPENWRLLYGVNPMVSVVEGFRWGLLDKAPPDAAAVAMSSAMMLIMLVGGIAFFHRVERTFADTI